MYWFCKGLSAVLALTGYAMLVQPNQHTLYYAMNVIFRQPFFARSYPATLNPGEATAHEW